MTDEEKLFIALLGEEQDDAEMFTMLEIVATLYVMGTEHRARRGEVLVAA